MHEYFLREEDVPVAHMQSYKARNLTIQSKMCFDSPDNVSGIKNYCLENQQSRLSA